MSPIMTALVWAGAAFLVGMAVIGIVTLLSRRRTDHMGGGRATEPPNPPTLGAPRETRGAPRDPRGPGCDH